MYSLVLNMGLFSRARHRVFSSLYALPPFVKLHHLVFVLPTSSPQRGLLVAQQHRHHLVHRGYARVGCFPAEILVC